jgi:hypothetical protein
MSQGLRTRPPEPAAAPVDVEALIEEARRRQRQRGRRFVVAAAVLLAAGLVVGIYFGLIRGGDLFGAGSGGPAAPSAVYHRGWILHERHELKIVPYAGAGHYVKLISESWKQSSRPYRRRELTYPALWNDARVERSRSELDRYAYDPKTNTIFEDPYEDPHSPGAGFIDPAQKARRMIESGQWKVAKTTGANGTPLLLFNDPAVGMKILFDAKTYVPLRVESLGFPLNQRRSQQPGPTCSFQESPQLPPSTTVDRTLTYEYLPPTKDNEKLVDIQQQHPSARTAPAKQMPKRFESIVNPPGCVPPPAP